MDPELLKLCTEAFVAGAKAMIKEAMKKQEGGFFECPLTNRRWAVANADKAEQIASKAMIARAWWESCKPDWAPPLPVGGDIGTLQTMENDEPLEVSIVGDYAHSLAYADYDFINHPSFHDWCCNVVAIRPDFRPLLRHLKLVPKPMPGFNWRINCWEPPVAGLVSR
jgi:hypothetical protein